MSENDMIAEYVKYRFTELLNTTDFALYKVSYACRNLVNGFVEIFNNIDFNKLAEQLKESDSIDK